MVNIAQLWLRAGNYVEEIKYLIHGYIVITNEELVLVYLIQRVNLVARRVCSLSRLRERVAFLLKKVG